MSQLYASFILLSSFFVLKIPHGFGTNFFQAMIKDKFEQRKIDTFMKINCDLYNKYIINNPEYCLEPRIPKIIHHIWVGSPLPPAQAKFRESWKRMHPDWEFMFWDDKAITEFGLQNQVAYDAAVNLSEKSDIARYEILFRYGGLYVDTDFECLKPFDVFHHCLDFYVGLHFVSHFQVFNGLIGSMPGHPILRSCIDNIKPRAVNDTNLWNTLQRTGPNFLTDCIKKTLVQNPERIVALPNKYVYPIPFWERKVPMDVLKKKWNLQKSFAIHHWHVSWNNYKAPGDK